MLAAFRRARVTLARLTANAKLINGSGQVRAAFAGRRGAAFAFSTLADVSPDQIRLTGSGRIERQPLVLNQAAVLTRAGDGWALAPTNLSFAGGTATVPDAAARGPRSMPRSPAMPLEMLDLFWPGTDFSGSATGRLDYAWKGNRNGRLDLKVRGLSRAGLVLASKPIDVGVAAIVNSNQAALRAVAASDGAIVGRAQARFSPMGSGPLMAELLNAPLFAQLRYTGPADTLWRLTGSEVLDMSGPLAVGADIGGRLADPVIHGSLKTQNARLESAVTGMVITNVASQARFSGPQLIFSQISGQTPGNGTVTGGGSITFSAARPCSTCRSTRTRRCCSTATMSPRASPVRCRSSRTAMAGPSRATSSSTRVASSSAAQAPPPRFPSSMFTKAGSIRKT